MIQNESPCPCLLLEVTSLFFVNEDKVQVIADAEFLVDVSHGGREVIAGQEQAYGDGFPTHGGSIHDLVLGYGVVLSVDVWCCSW